jgi:hypothetical protein
MQLQQSNHSEGIQNQSFYIPSYSTYAKIIGSLSGFIIVGILVISVDINK